MKAHFLFPALLLTFAGTLVAQTGPDEAPGVAGPWINAGHPQRSMIQAVGVRFDRNVSALVRHESLKIRNIATGELVDLSAATLIYDPRNDSANWMVERERGALLSDGNYIAWLEIDTLLDERGRSTSAVNGVPLDDFTFGFHQFTGDTDGDRDVDFRDASVLRETWQRNLDNPAYHSFLDFDLSDLVDESDRSLVETTYFSLLPAAPAVHLFLRNDTGESASENATAVYAAAFGSTGAEDAASWRARLGGGPAVDITDLVADGGAVLDEAFIDQLHGGALSPGVYRLSVEASDASGDPLASDALDFEYLGRVPYPPYFTSTPPHGVALGQIRAAEPLNLSAWAVETWPGSQGPSQWVIAPDGLSVEQTRNSQPSALISDRSFLNLRVTGRFRVDTSSDDDLMGFIFGYQNNKQFYIFDWKQGTQGFVGGTALRGMCIKRIDAGAGEFTEPDFWWSNVDRPNTTILVPPNDIGWVDFQDYDITLDFTPGRIVVEVHEEGQLLDRLEVEDDTFTGGRFGFYNYSQDSVIYSGFTAEALNNVYFYNAKALDPDGDVITYSFAPNEDGSMPPAAATLNANNGSLVWQPDVAGTFPFTLVASDADGLTDVQRFDVLVSPIDEPPTVYITKTSPSVLPGEDVAVRVVAADDQFIFRTRLFVDDVEVALDELGSFTTSFDAPGLIELRALAVDSAEQVSTITSHIRVRDPAAPPDKVPSNVAVAPPGQTSGQTADVFPLVSFQAPRSSADDPTRFVGTVDPNGGTLRNWFLEWAPASAVDFSQLSSPTVLWQKIAEGTAPLAAAEIAVIAPANFPDELIAFRLRAENTNGLGRMVSVVLNPRSSANSSASQNAGSGMGIRALAAFTAPLDPADDRTQLRGTVDENGGALQSWVVDYAPRNSVNLSDLADPAIAWTLLEQGAEPLTDGLLASLDPAAFLNEVYVFRLVAVNTGGLGSVATLTFNPVATDLSGPVDTSGIDPGSSQRPVTRIAAPDTAGGVPSALTGTVLSNGGTLERWVVDYAPRSEVNPDDLSDPSVSWTLLAEGAEERTNEELASLTDPAFQFGSWVIRLRVFNTNGLGSVASILLDSGDTTQPSVAFTAPDAEATVGYLTEVRGTIGSGGGVLDFWKLEIAPSEEVALTNLNANANWVELGSGDTPLDDQPLGQIDPTNLRNGSYVLRLSAFNTNGRGFRDGILVHVSGEAKLGNFRLEFVDLNLPLVGIPIQISRIYDTLNANRSGDFGFGWTLGIGDPDIRETVPDTGDSFFFATPFEIGSRVFLTTPDGRRVGFTFNVRSPRNRFLYVDYEPYFIPDPGVYETLTIAPSDFERVEVDAGGAVYTPLLPFGYNPDRYRLTTKEGLVYDYDQRAGLQRITDRNGQSVAFSRSAITHSSGQSVTIARDSRGRVTSITAPGGATYTYRYDSNGDLVAIDDPNGETTTLSYLRNPAHYLDKVAEPADAARGRYSRRVIYENGRFSRVEDADGNIISSQTIQPGQFTGTRSDALGNVTDLVYDNRGNVIQETTPGGAVTILEYTDPANPDKETAMVDPNGNRTTFAYDARGNLIASMDHAGNLRELTYNNLDKPVSVTLRNLAGEVLYTITAEYDAKGNLTRVVDCSGRERLVAYDASGRPLSRTDFDGSLELYEYSAAGIRNPSKITDGEGTTFEFTYNARGLPTEIRDATGNTFSYRYDAKGQLIEQTDNAGNSVVYHYDANGNATRVIDRDGRITQLEYDSKNRVIREIKIVTDDENYSDDLITTIDYDAADRVTSVTDSLGRATTYTYDVDDRLISVADPLGRVSSRSYDGNANIIEATDRLGRRREFAYDYRDLVIREDWFEPGGSDPVETILSEYDEVGKLTRISDNRTVETYTHECGRLVSISNAGSTGLPFFEFTLGYDGNSRITSITDQLGARVERTYDNAGDLAALAWFGGGLPGSGVTFQRDDLGALTAMERFSDVLRTTPVGSSQYTRDPFEGTITRIRHLNASGSLVAPGWDFTFERTSENRTTSSSLQGDDAAYTYSPDGQLTGATHSDPLLPAEVYQYDALGNRTDSHLGGPSVIDATGRLASDQIHTYQYDEENNLILETNAATGSTRSFTYDHRTRLLSVTDADAASTVVSRIEFLYDPLDRVIGRTINGVVTYTAYHQDNAWADYADSGAVLTRYLHDETTDGLIARWSSAGGVEWMLTDQTRSVRGAIDDSGNLIASVQYDSFGNPLAGEAYLQTNRFGFTGREYIASGLHHYRARAYSSRTGRFLSDDPLGISAGDANLQRYAFNDPLNFLDPTGLTNFPEVNAVNAIGQSVIRLSVPISKALLVQAVSGAILNVIFDYICLAIAGETDRISLGRVIRQAVVGVGLGTAIGGAGLAVGGAAQGLSFAFGGSWITALIGNWIAKLAVYNEIGVLATRVGFKAVLSAPSLIESPGTDSESCDTFFYRAIGGD